MSQDKTTITNVVLADAVITSESADASGCVDLSTLLAANESVGSAQVAVEDRNVAATDPVAVVLDGITYEIASDSLLQPSDISINSISTLSKVFVAGASWTEVVDIVGVNAGPSVISAADASSIISHDAAISSGDWTVVVTSGTATVDATNNQITLIPSAGSNGVEATVVTSDGSSHDVASADKIQWHI